MSNEIDIQLQNSQAFGQLQQGFSSIEKSMASIVVTLDKIVKASKQAEDSQKKAAEGPIDSIKKARDAVRGYQKQVEEAGKGTPQLASALMKLADARAELTRQERAAAMTMNTNKAMVSEYKAVGSAVEKVTGNLKEMYQTVRSTSAASGMSAVTGSTEKLNQTIEKTIQLQQKAKQTHEQMVLAAMKAVNARVSDGDMALVADIRKQLQQKLSSAEINAAIDQLINKRIVAAHRFDRPNLISEDERNKMFPSDGNFHNTLSLWADGAESMKRLNAIVDEAVAAGREMETVTKSTSVAIKSQEEDRKQALNIAKQELTVQQQIVKAIHDQQAAFASKGGKGNISIAGLRSQIPGVSGSDFDDAFSQLVADEVLNPKRAAKKSIGAPGNFVFGSGEYSQVSIAERQKFDEVMRGMQSQEAAAVPERAQMSTRDLYEATRESRNARRNMQMEFYNQSQGPHGGGYLYHTLIKEAEEDKKQLFDNLKKDIISRNAESAKQMQMKESFGASRGSVFHDIEKEVEDGKKQLFDSLKKDIVARNTESAKQMQMKENFTKSQGSIFHAIEKEVEDGKRQLFDSLKKDILSRSTGRREQMLEQLSGINAQLDQNGVSDSARKSLYNQKYILERRMKEEDDQYRKFAERQNAAPKGSPEFFRARIRAREEKMGREADPAVREQLRQSIERNRDRLRNAESPVVGNSPAYFEQQRRKLLEQRSKIPAGDMSAMKKNVADLKALEDQSQKTNQTYKQLQATLDSQAKAGNASEYEEKISALKTLQSTVASNTTEYKQLGAQIKQTENEFSQFKGELVATAGSADTLESELKKLQDSINKLEPNTPEWKKMNDELFTTKRRLDEVNKQTKQYQAMQGKGWFGRTFMTPMGGGGGPGGDGSSLGGFGGIAMGQIKTLAATYVGLYEGINAVVRELEHGKDALRRQFEVGIVGQQEVVRQTATLGNEMLGPMTKWAQQNQGRLMTSQENILNIAGFTKQMGVTDMPGIKEMTEASLKVSRGDVEVAKGLQQLAVLLMKTQGSTDYKGALGQARQISEATAGVNELIFNQNIADRLVTMSIASQMQKIKPLSVEQIGEFMGAGSRTFSDTSGDTISRAILVGFDSLIDFKPRKSYKGTRVPDEVMEAYKNASTLQQRFDIVSGSKELGFQFAKEKADRQGPLAETIEKMFTSKLFRDNLSESQKLVTSLSEASVYYRDQIRVVEDNTRVLGIMNTTLMGMQESQTTDGALASGGSQKIMDEVAKIDLAGWDAYQRGMAGMKEENARAKMLASGQPYNEAFLKLQNVQELIRQQKEKGMSEDTPQMKMLRIAEDGLASLSEEIRGVMKPAERELAQINAKIASYEENANSIPQERRFGYIDDLYRRRNQLDTPAEREVFNRAAEQKRAVRDGVREAVDKAGAGPGSGAGKGLIFNGAGVVDPRPGMKLHQRDIQGVADAPVGATGLFSVPAERLDEVERTVRLKKLGIEDSIIQSAKAADNQVSGQSNSGKDRFKGDTVSGTAGSRIIAEMMNSPRERNLVDAIVPLVSTMEKVMMGEPPEKHDYPKPYGSRFPGDDQGEWPKGKAKSRRATKDEFKKAATQNGGNASGGDAGSSSSSTDGKKTDFAENVRAAAAALKQANDEAGGPKYAPSNRFVNNGALRAHMETGEVGNIMGDLPLNGSSLDASAMARQLRGKMSEMDPSLVGQFMGQANGYNGFVAAMNDPMRLTPEEKEKIAKEAVKRRMEGGAAADPTGLRDRFKEGSPIAVDSPFVQEGTQWFERELAAEASGGPRLDMTMPEGSARAARIAKEKVEEKRRLKEEGKVAAEVPLTKKQLATPEGRAEQKARDMRDARRAGKVEAAPVEDDPVVLRARQRMADKKKEREERIKELEAQRTGTMEKKADPVDDDPVVKRARQRMEDKKREREERIKELDAQRSGTAVDPEMKDILKNLAIALAAFSNATKGNSQPEMRVARTPVPRMPVATSVS